MLRADDRFPDATIQIEDRETIVYIRYLSTPSDRDFAALLGAYEELYSTRDAYGIALATMPSARQTTAQNRRTGEWMKSRRAHYEGRLKGMAFVSTSAMMRFGLSMIFLIQPLTVPYVVVASEVEAEAFLRGHLR